MTVLVLDSGAITGLARRSRQAVALIAALGTEGLWPPIVLSPVLIECLRGDPAKDAAVNQFLKTCDIVEDLPEALARRAAYLRTRARLGSAIDALVVAAAEPGGCVLTSDPSDLEALAGHAHDVLVARG
jgi:hypothetical protein